MSDSHMTGALFGDGAPVRALITSMPDGVAVVDRRVSEAISGRDAAIALGWVAPAEE